MIPSRSRPIGGRKSKLTLFDVLLTAGLVLLALIIIFPVYNALMISMSSFQDLGRTAGLTPPREFNFEAYELIFTSTKLAPSIFVSLFVTVFGTALNMALSTAAAYALARRSLPGRKLFIFLILFTMLFQGGLIPLYFTVRSIGLTNSLLAMILPPAINTFYLIIMINYFRGIPASLEESARIDGANDIQTLVKIIIPISMPTIAAITLFYSVDRWNEWWHALIFVSDVNKFPMQLVLREMLINLTQMMRDSAGAEAAENLRMTYPPSLRMAAVVVTAVPIMLVYPYLQKYFTKGLLIGSLKG